MDLDEQNRIGREAAEAMRRLTFNKDFQAMNLFLKTRLDEMRKRNDKFTGQELSWNQGQCQNMQFILDLPDMVKLPGSSLSTH